MSLIQDLIIYSLLPPGTAEFRHTANGTKTLTLKNVHFSSQNMSFGLESIFFWEESGGEGRVQVRVTRKTDLHN